MAYLAFLLSPQSYFPILPTRFDELLHFYGIKRSISGHVSWERYSILLKLAEELKSRIAIYGQASAIEIQSYMYVVSYLIEEGKIPKKKPAKITDFKSELEARIRRAKEKERIGLLGEQLIYENEKAKLKDARRSDLANKVRLVSSSGEDSGFDILSFSPEGNELHIEVKTTTRSQIGDDGFWVTENEKARAEKDINWVIYRVWNIDITPYFENLGNIVLNKRENWQWNASGWYVRYKKVS